MTIKDSVIIVTGASSGIGEATAKLLTQKGAKVVLVARSKQKLKLLSSELKESYVIPTDLRDENATRAMIEKAYQHFGKIDILINNAGRGYHVPLLEIESQKFHELFELDVVAPLIAMQSVIPYMKKQGRGMIINISSGTSLMAIPSIAAYSSLKRALNGISLTAREELEKDHITVSIVYPYITKTHFHQNLLNEKSQIDTATDLPEGDTPEYVAGLIANAIKTEEAEIFAHDWMKKVR